MTKDKNQPTLNEAEIISSLLQHLIDAGDSSERTTDNKFSREELEAKYLTGATNDKN